MEHIHYLVKSLRKKYNVKIKIITKTSQEWLEHELNKFLEDIADCKNIVDIKYSTCYTQRNTPCFSAKIIMR